MKSSFCKKNPQFTDFFRGQMLGWYDNHARELPWRAPVGVKPNPYHVWLSEIMLQQTTVPTVKSYFDKFVSIWPSVTDMANSPQEEILKEWAGLGYYARARNLHKCAQIVTQEYKSMFPDNEEGLIKLPGIGPYTAAAIISIAFDKPAAVMDGNIERIMARIFAVTTPLPDAKPILKSHIEDLSLNRKDRPGDFAQSLMDLGSSICTPTKPKCVLCPVNDVCMAKGQGIESELPKKVKKKPKPQKYGHVYWIENHKGKVFLVRRPEKGLLGGMLALPTTEWVEHQNPRALIPSKDTGQFIEHVFTHFKLRLHIHTAKSSNGLKGKWVSKQEVEGLPTVFNKAYKLAITL